jgi:glutathione peroxidase
MTTAHDIAFTGIDGADLPLSSFAGKAVLLVNVASACGFTPQYGPLEALWENGKDKGVVVLGVPCNDFGGQEPGSEDQIKTFCETQFGVTFPMTGKVAITDPSKRHPFYAYVAETLGEGALPRWNFHKYLIGPDGALAGTFPSNIKPDGPEIKAAISEVLG